MAYDALDSLSRVDTQYEDLLRQIITEGDRVPDRTGTGTWELFGPQMSWNLQQGFPLITTKKVFTRGIIAELLWLLSGSTNIKPLTDQNVHIWDDWASESGEVGPVYGAQWRDWGHNPDSVPTGLDQISALIEGIQRDPHGRRHIVTAWNPDDIPKMALAPCHALFQVHVNSERELSLKLYQRSADMFLGVPFNIASYALLTHMIAQQTDCTVGRFIWTAGSAHVYVDHLDAVTRQLKREPYPFPTLALSQRDSIFDYTVEDVELLDYRHHDPISAKVSV